MTVASARRKLHQYGKTGNFRFKGLLLAALDRDNSTEDYAKAWPGSHESDYRFLKQNERYNPERELNRTAVGEKGTARYRTLKNYAVDASSLPKRLSNRDHMEDEGDRVTARLDDAIPRMLFAAADPEEINTLFREQLLDVVMEGARQRKVAQEASNVINATTRQGDVPVASDDDTARQTAQGAEIRDNREDYATVSWDTTKLTEGARITDETQDQAMVDVIERQIEKVGRSVQNGVNRFFLTELVDQANGNYDTQGSNQGYQALNEAVGVVDEEDFRPDTYVTGPQYRTALFNDSNLSYANRAGTNEVLRNREDAPIVGDIAGLNMHAAMSSSTYDDGTDPTWSGGNETFGFENDGEKGAVVYDRNHIHTILYSPNGEGMEIKDYEDPIRDLNGVNARLYADAQYSQERAAATIQY